MDINDIKKHSQVIDIQYNRIYKIHTQPNDTFYHLQSHLKTLDMERAWKISQGNPDIVVAENSDEFRINTDTDNQLQFAVKLLNG